jgi:hypothetical protein
MTNIGRWWNRRTPAPRLDVAVRWGMTVDARLERILLDEYFGSKPTHACYLLVLANCDVANQKLLSAFVTTESAELTLSQRTCRRGGAPQLRTGVSSVTIFSIRSGINILGATVFEAFQSEHGAVQ